MATETLTATAPMPLDLLLWRRFKCEVGGLVEQTYAANPGLADLGPILPHGTEVVVTIPATSAGKTIVRKLIRLTGN